MNILIPNHTQNEQVGRWEYTGAQNHIKVEHIISTPSSIMQLPSPESLKNRERKKSKVLRSLTSMHDAIMTLSLTSNHGFWRG